MAYSKARQLPRRLKSEREKCGFLVGYVRKGENVMLDPPTVTPDVTRWRHKRGGAHCGRRVGPTIGRPNLGRGSVVGTTRRPDHPMKTLPPPKEPNSQQSNRTNSHSGNFARSKAEKSFFQNFGQYIRAFFRSLNVLQHQCGFGTKVILPDTFCCIFFELIYAVATSFGRLLVSRTMAKFKV